VKRLARGGRIDRARPVPFSWNGRSLSGFTGDTLASALLGNGVDVIGTSVAHGRPRGITSAGLEEATAFAQVTSGTVSEPLQRMTSLPLFRGLSAEGRITKGRLTEARDDARFDKRFEHCDLLVVGAGPAGLAAALVGTHAGARVILVDADTEAGGALLREEARINGAPALEWVSATMATLGAAAETRVLTATIACALMDQNGVLLAQRLGAHLPIDERGDRPEQRLWHVRARRIILATGALERPIVFQDNDRPGIMLASGARSYLHRHALAPDRGLVFTTNDDAYRTAVDWHAAGVVVAGIVDIRPAGHGELRQRAMQAGIPVHHESVVEATTGDADGRLVGVRVRTPTGRREIDADLLAVSGGWAPNINLHLQLRGATGYDTRLGATVPTTALSGQWVVGAARGELSLRGCLASGASAASEALADLERPQALGAVLQELSGGAEDVVPQDAPSLVWRVSAPDGDETRSFVDLHRDATVAGVQRAVDAGLRHIEHVKRFTLIGTGVEQGRAAGANAGWLTASLTGQPASDVGVSGSRPPVEPMPFHLLGGRAKGAMYEPVRTTALHEMHAARGAQFESVGQWLRPSCYPHPGESARETVSRECRAARTAVGLMDVSTLGKIDVRGPDAAWFLDRLYVNTIAAIPVGMARYSLMCRLDGSILDDGLVMRTGDQRFFVTTSTGHATAVVDWMEEWLQTEWPSRRVWVTPITEQYSTIAVVGPRARDLVGRVAHDLDVSKDAFPFLAVRRGTLAGIPDGQVARVSFSGELAFELSVPWRLGLRLWESLMSLGASLDVTPYGLDALQALRMEKGYIIVGQDTEGLTTPYDVGLGWMASKKKDFIGRRSHERAAPSAADRLQLVGFVRNDADDVVPEGAGLVAAPGGDSGRIEGHVSSSCWSETLGRSLGLALVRAGRARHGEVLHAPLDSSVARVTVVDPVHYDPRGVRRDG
jgi:sarcosine oxidase subunit alpha